MDDELKAELAKIKARLDSIETQLIMGDVRRGSGQGPQLNRIESLLRELLGLPNLKFESERASEENAADTRAALAEERRRLGR